MIMAKREKINQIIEEKVFGNKCVWFSFVNNELTEGTDGCSPFLKVLDNSDEENLEYHDLPDYWNEIGCAFEIAEKLKLTLYPSYDGWEVFYSNTSGSSRDTKWIGTTNNKEWIKSNYASEAICLSALKILNVDINKICDII